MKQELVGRRFVVSGRVQGVGYRYFVEDVAGKIGLEGYVRNLRDGSVEVFAMGTHEQLRQLLPALERGPMMSRVTSVAEEPAALDPNYQGNFIVEFTLE